MQYGHIQASEGLHPSRPRSTPIKGLVSLLFRGLRVPWPRLLTVARGLDKATVRPEANVAKAGKRHPQIAGGSLETAGHPPQPGEILSHSA